MITKLRANAVFLCLVVLVALTASSFSQRLAWTFDVMPSPTDQTATLNASDPYISPTGEILLSATWFKAPSGGYQTGFIWLSSAGAKLAELRVDPGPNYLSYMYILNVKRSEVCVLLSDLGGFYIRTYSRKGSNLTLLQSAAITNFDQNTRIFANGYNRIDTAGTLVFQSIRDGQGNVVGTKITRYLF
jgi:hypothetical protein